MSQMPPDLTRLPALFERQRQAFALLPMPPAERRVARLAYPPYGGWVQRLIQRWFIR